MFVRNGDAVISGLRGDVGDNVAINNVRRGILAPHATDRGGNVAFGNGTEPQCTGVVCSGP